MSSSSDAFLMSLAAGLSTGVGGIIAVIGVDPDKGVPPTLMAFVLSLAAGVMLSVSLMELILPALDQEDIGRILLCLGLGLAALLSLALAHHSKNQGSSSSLDSIELGLKAENAKKNGTAFSSPARTYRLGLLMMIALTAHNFPEGIAVAVSASANRHSGLVVAVAVAIHNIPEGLAIAVPILAATGSWRRALTMTLVSGLSEPFGAMIGLAILQPWLTASGIEDVEAAVAGVMSWLAMAELLPEAARQKRPIWLIVGGITGWFVMWITTKIL